MEIKIEDIKSFLDKKVRIVIANKYTYVGEIVSIGPDYLKFKDKYNTDHLFMYSNIIHIEVVQ